MERFDRLFGTLLLLRDGRAVPASALAARFGVSRRTIYRDLEALSVAGVPVYAERGRGGGIRLLEGYFLPPLMFSEGEAIAILVALSLLRGVRAAPFPREAETAVRKLLAAVPERLRATLARAERVVGVERPPDDIFHPELDDARPAAESERESETVTAFLQALLDGRMVRLRYRSPYRAEADSAAVVPRGLFWDRDRWYLVGQEGGASGRRRLWRAERVVALAADRPSATLDDFDVRAPRAGLAARGHGYLAGTRAGAGAPGRGTGGAPAAGLVLPPCALRSAAFGRDPDDLRRG